MLSNGYGITRRIETVFKSLITKNANLLQLAFSLITGHGLQIREIGCTKFETLIKLVLNKGFPK